MRQSRPVTSSTVIKYTVATGAAPLAVSATVVTGNLTHLVPAGSLEAAGTPDLSCSAAHLQAAGGTGSAR